MFAYKNQFSECKSSPKRQGHRCLDADHLASQKVQAQGPQLHATGLLSEPNPERRYMVCEAMIDVAAAYFNVSSKALRQPGRCVQSISRIRQIAMYVTHTGLGLTMTDVGKGFCRDRTTVMHACHQIEDLRDDEDFDLIVEQFNRIAVAAFASLIGAAQ